ncbi:MAG: hypothetical protein AAFO82_16425, partial [Bacteroidota bacterium]
IKENILSRYKKLKEENNTSLVDLSKRVDIEIETVNRSAQRRFEKIEEQLFRKKDQYKKQELVIELKKQRNKELGVARRNFLRIRSLLQNENNEELDSTLKSKLVESEIALRQKLEKDFHALGKKLQSISRLEWASEKKAREMVEKRGTRLRERLNRNNNRSTELRFNRVVSREEKKVQRLLEKHFNSLERELSRSTTNGQLSSRKKENVDHYRIATNDLLQQQLVVLKNNFKQQKSTKDHSKDLIHAARSLEYLGLQLDFAVREDQGWNSFSIFKNEISNREQGMLDINSLDKYIYELQYVERLDVIHQETIQKSIQVLKEIDAKYGKGDYEIEYIPAPTQLQIDKILAELSDSSKVDLHSYYGYTYSNNFLLSHLYNTSQDTLQTYDVQYLEEMLEDELIMVRPPSKEESLDFVNYFEQVLEMNQTMNLWLDSIALQYEGLRNQLTQLEEEYAGRAYKAKKHANHLSTLTELSVHMLDAFKYGAFVQDSITISDTLHQRIEEIIDNRKVSYNQIALKEKVIAKGTHVNKWINRKQFQQIMEDPLTQQAYLGLLY